MNLLAREHFFCRAILLMDFYQQALDMDLQNQDLAATIDVVRTRAIEQTE